MSNKVAIVTDSTCDLPETIRDQYQLCVVPLHMHWDGVTYTDGVDITAQAFYKKLATSTSLPTTSQPSTAAFTAVYNDLLVQGYDILVLTISSKISGTYASAFTAAQAFPAERIVIVDTLSASLALGIMAIQCARAAQNGATLQECREVAEGLIGRLHILFAVETLEYLHKGGRINTATKFLGTALNLKPILALENGVVEPIDRVRTSKKARERLLDMVAEALGSKTEIPFLGMIGANATREMQELLAQAQERFEITELLSGELSPVLGTHVGPGTVGLTFMV